MTVLNIAYSFDNMCLRQVWSIFKSVNKALEQNKDVLIRMYDFGKSIAFASTDSKHINITKIEKSLFVYTSIGTAEITVLYDGEETPKQTLLLLNPYQITPLKHRHLVNKYLGCYGTNFRSFLSEGELDKLAGSIVELEKYLSGSPNKPTLSEFKNILYELEENEIGFSILKNHAGGLNLTNKIFKEICSNLASKENTGFKDYLTHQKI